MVCVVRTDVAPCEDGVSASSAQNVIRVPLHPPLDVRREEFVAATLRTTPVPLAMIRSAKRNRVILLTFVGGELGEQCAVSRVAVLAASFGAHTGLPHSVLIRL